MESLTVSTFNIMKLLQVMYPKYYILIGTNVFLGGGYKYHLSITTSNTALPNSIFTH